MEPFNRVMQCRKITMFDSSCAALYISSSNQRNHQVSEIKTATYTSEFPPHPNNYNHQARLGYLHLSAVKFCSGTEYI